MKVLCNRTPFNLSSLECNKLKLTFAAFNCSFKVNNVFQNKNIMNPIYTLSKKKTMIENFGMYIHRRLTYIVASTSLRLLGLFVFMYSYSSLLINISSCQKPANALQLRWMNSMGKLLSPGEMCHIMDRKWVFMLILMIFWDWWFFLCVTRQENKIWIAFSMIKVCHVKCWNNKQIPITKYLHLCNILCVVWVRDEFPHWDCELLPLIP